MRFFTKFFLGSMTAGLFAGPAMAFAPAGGVPLPPEAAVQRPPVGKGQVDESDTSLPADYIEEEFLVSGTGRIFLYDAAGIAQVEKDNQPWVTRVLVRRPADGRPSSGWAFVEPLHPEIGKSFAWRQSEEYFGDRGDVWIGITTTRNLNLYAGGDPLEKLKRADPARYGTLRFGDGPTEGGLTWDVIAAVGRLAKDGGLTGGTKVNKSVIGGWSGAGALTLFFANSFAMRERMPDGGPIFDAVLLGEPGWYPRINARGADLMPYDIRQTAARLDVPVISVNSSAPIEFGMAFRPRPDSDEAIGRFRAYEIAGANHRGAREPMGGDLSASCGAPMSDFPLHAYYSLAIDHLKIWSDTGKAPPPSQPVAIDRFGKVLVDEAGNPVGGVRSPELDVPVARHYQTHDAPLVACRGGGRMDQFSRDELIRRYGNKAGYVAAVERRAAALVNDGWLLPADAAAAIGKAKAFNGFDRR